MTPSTPHISATAEAVIKAKFDEHRRDRVGPLDQSDVDVIATAALFETGLIPNIDLVRRIGGGGSPNTVHPKLKDWARRVPAMLKLADVPAELQALWFGLQKQARLAGEQGLDEARQELATAQAVTQAEREDLQSQHATLVAERQATDRVVSELKESFDALRLHNAQLQADLDLARHAQAGDADALAEARTELRQARERADAATAELAQRDQVLENMRAERTTLLEARSAADTRIQQLITDLASDARTHKAEQDEHADAVITMQASINEAREAMAGLRATLTAERAATTGALKEAREARATIETQQARHATEIEAVNAKERQLQADLEKEREAREVALRQLAGITAAREVLQSTLDGLGQHQERLLDQMEAQRETFATLGQQMERLGVKSDKPERKR